MQVAAEFVPILPLLKCFGKTIMIDLKYYNYIRESCMQTTSSLKGFRDLFTMLNFILLKMWLTLDSLLSQVTCITGLFSAAARIKFSYSFLKDRPGKNLASWEKNTELFSSESLEHSLHPGRRRGEMTGQVRSQLTCEETCLVTETRGFGRGPLLQLGS